jgi:hypothetical protein
MDKKRSDHMLMSLRLKPGIGKLLEELSAQLGVSKTAVITLSLRVLAQREGIEIKEDEVSDAN